MIAKSMQTKPKKLLYIYIFEIHIKKYMCGFIHFLYAKYNFLFLLFGFNLDVKYNVYALYAKYHLCFGCDLE